MIVQDAVNYIKDRYKELFERSSIEKVCFGLHFTAVQLSNGFCGMAKTETMNYNLTQEKLKRELSPFCAGMIRGQYVSDLFNYPSDSNLVDILKLSVLNALSAEIVQKGNYNIIDDKDPIELIEITEKKKICIVGAFQSYIDKITHISNNFCVVELDEGALYEAQKRFFVPAERSAEVFSKSDIIIITGATLANKTIDSLLKRISSNKQLIVVGPTAGVLPDILFRYHVDIIGAIRITDVDKMFQIVEEGGTAYHLYKCLCAQKICILNDNR